MPSSKRLACLLSLSACAVTAGCGSSGGGEDTATVAKASAPAAISVPAPKATPMLEIGGQIQTHNQGLSLALDRAGIERLGLERIKLYEPFKKRTMSFRAVPLNALLKLAAPSASAKTLHSIALNDYVVDIPASVAGQEGVYLATRNGDGSPIKVEDGGPIRVVFTDGTPGADDDNYWIWSLASIQVK